MNFWKKHIWTLLYLLALTLILALSVRGLLKATNVFGTETIRAEPQAAYTIVIDPGHGGADGGAVGVTGAGESELNLAVALKLRQVLALCGRSCVMTRTTAAALEDPDASTIAAKKVTDTKNRVALINATENALLVSIHQNKFPEGRYSGAQVFWAPAEGSQALAEHTQDILRAALNPDNHRMAKKADGGIYLMHHITCPGILVECGFLSNPAEEALLQTDGYQTRLAAAIAAALLGWEAAQG